MHKRKRKSNTNQTQVPIKQYTVKEQTELLIFLLNTLSNLGRNSVKSLLSHGRVLVNDQAVTKYNYPLQPGQTVSIRKVKTTNTSLMAGVIILHEDEDIIVIEKEAGLLSVSSSKENELTAYRQLMDHVRRGNPKNRIFVVHRLDRDTSGVMMFAKSKDVQQTMQNSWKDIVQERLYIALVEGSVKKKEGTISSWLKETTTFKTYSSPRSNDGKLAVTHYNVIKSNQNFSLLKVSLDTGRKNQIRVHMQDIGHSIVGDKKYGSHMKLIGRLGLHAQVLSFVHPTTGLLLRFETKIPKSFLSPFRSTPTKN
ncbi:RluA family pseudouridine synthase [Shimazuella alba]|uniref:Pseudouridine synthase n=1 Tax=Shimazuella alba TaxID=2690964 RepID=A0A6I4VXT8_9BACL|nr:RluA family pseudouridine synthase [Shimazuella alba]MXQ54785.1 RluA family pseudouridine synthase [Shimazuella alba]